MTDLHINDITDRIIGCAVRVHKELGPGLLESAYEGCLTFEFLEAGLRFERQKKLPVFYRGQIIDCGYRIDFLVEDLVIVEVKSVVRLEPIHRAQVRSYLRLHKRTVGLLFNFNVKWLTKEGMDRVVNDLPAELDTLKRASAEARKSLGTKLRDDQASEDQASTG